MTRMIDQNEDTEIECNSYFNKGVIHPTFIELVWFTNDMETIIKV